jgi:YD repeat-containing protein
MKEGRLSVVHTWTMEHYTGTLYDAANRDIADINVGTNGGTTWTVPGSVPSRSDDTLVTSYTYTDAGYLYETTDPRGIVTRNAYDSLGRTTKTIEDYVDGAVSDDDDKTTEYTYNSAGMTSLTADLTGGGGETTAYVYGVTTGSSSVIDSNDIVGATEWPDPSTGAASSSQEDVTTVNALGQTVTRPC